MQDPTLYLTPECTIVYPSLFEPTAYKSEEPTYSATFLIAKNNDLSALKDVIKAAAIKKWGQQVNFKTLNYPVRNGDEKAIDENGILNKDNFYYNRYFIRAKSKWQPAIVNIYNEQITDENDLYGGCIVRAYFSFYGYDYMGKKGVGCGLRAVCKVADGEPLGGGRINTSEVFNEVLQERDTFIDSPPNFNEREYNETGQQNEIPEPQYTETDDDIPF